LDFELIAQQRLEGWGAIAHTRATLRAVHVTGSDANGTGWQRPWDQWAVRSVGRPFNDEAVYVEPKTERLHLPRRYCALRLPGTMTARPPRWEPPQGGAGLSSDLYRAARVARDVHAVERSVETGDPSYVERRAKNVIVGRLLGRSGVWRRL
jgi:hypothetical protein